MNDQFSVVSLLLDQILKVPDAPTSLMKNNITCLCLLMGKLGDSKWTEDSCKDIFRLKINKNYINCLDNLTYIIQLAK